MILMKRVYVDIISEKEKKLHQLQSDAEGAVDIVTRAISGLELVNQEIEDTSSTTDQWEKYFDNGAQRILCDKGKGVCSNCHRLDNIDPLARYCRYCGAKLAQEDSHEVH